MNDKLDLKKVLPVGLMLFSFFFGAGNLIFPPVLGQMAGSNIPWAILGFCISGVGLPLLGVLAMAMKRSDKPEDMTKPIGTFFSRLIVILCALTIGPFFAIPRTAAVSFETGILPLLPPEVGTIGMGIYSVCFFALSYYFAMNPSQIITTIGKVMSPLLLICLAVLIACVFLNPLGMMAEPNSMYVTAPFFKGFQQGYNTMDLLCALLFGAVTIQTIQLQGVTDYKMLTKICMAAGFIAAACLAFIYSALAYMGAISTQTFGFVANGAQLLNMVAYHYLGLPGQVVLAAIIFFACMTTSIGLTTSISSNFEEMSNFKVEYQRFAIFITLFSLFVSNFGLNKIIALSIPVICALYPIIIAVVILNIGEPIVQSKKWVYRCCLTLTALFALGDGLRAAGVSLVAVDAVLAEWLPLFSIGFGWILPCFGGIVLGMVLDKLNRKRA